MGSDPGRVLRHEVRTTSTDRRLGRQRNVCVRLPCVKTLSHPIPVKRVYGEGRNRQGQRTPLFPNRTPGFVGQEDSTSVRPVGDRGSGEGFLLTLNPRLLFNYSVDTIVDYYYRFSNFFLRNVQKLMSLIPLQLFCRRGEGSGKDRGEPQRRNTKKFSGI